MISRLVNLFRLDYFTYSFAHMFKISLRRTVEVSIIIASFNGRIGRMMIYSTFLTVSSYKPMRA